MRKQKLFSLHRNYNWNGYFLNQNVWADDLWLLSLKVTLLVWRVLEKVFYCPMARLGGRRSEEAGGWLAWLGRLRYMAGGWKAAETGEAVWMLLRMVLAADVFGWNAVVVVDVQKH